MVIVIIVTILCYCKKETNEGFTQCKSNQTLVNMVNMPDWPICVNNPKCKSNQTLYKMHGWPICVNNPKCNSNQTLYNMHGLPICI